ncbi:MAG TPA: hypothetical protein VNZ64_06405, partial [Candidatus Acidoferrum sp.]|nr:hypothetical protein [Candidatus Acidoferrum sp.]
VVDEFPFGVSEIASVSHPQFAGVSDQKSTVNSENFFGFVEFSNTLLAIRYLRLYPQAQPPAEPPDHAG